MSKLYNIADDVSAKKKNVKTFRRIGSSGGEVVYKHKQWLQKVSLRK